MKCINIGCIDIKKYTDSTTSQSSPNCEIDDEWANLGAKIHIC